MGSSTHLWCLAILLVVMTTLLPCISAGSCIANGITVCCTKDHCKDQISPDGCYCDNLCRQHGDCCDDIDQLCPIENCTDGSVRLSNGANDLQGRVEVCVGNSWGTVCHNKWNNVDAQVVCKQLGHPNSGAAGLRNARFSQGIGSIVMTNVNCTGNESSLLDCEHSNLTQLCNHGMDASVICGNAVCADGDIRLVNGLYSNQGRVEVCLDGVWGTICDNAWDINDAKTVCRQLGLSTTRVIAVGRAYFGSGKGPINLNDVQCKGTEDRLLNCTYNQNSDCTHDEDAGVFCGITLGCLDGSIRLADGTNKSEGRVEVCVNGAWTTVCDDGWDDYAAKVTCRQLGYSVAGAISFNGTKFGPGNPNFDVFFTNVTCTGHEKNFLACQYFRTNSSMCPHTRDAGIRCLPGPGECTNGKVRLVDGADDFEGRVEVCLFEKWGTVCDHSWSTAHAEVVCRQLGLPTTGATALSGAYFGIGTGPINVDDLQCTGDETNITQCVFTSNDNCQHSNDAGVRCPCNHGDVRLVGGSTPLEGRVEVCFSGIWGTVTDDGWENKDSNVVCRQLGYWGNVSKPVLYAAYGQGKGPIFMDYVSCRGTEQRLIDCIYNPFTFYDSHAEDAGVVCFDGNRQGECTDGETRLDDSGKTGNRYYGRVEVCLGGQWGTICGLFWDTASANVVCGSLGYPKVSEPFRAGLTIFPGPGTGPVNMNFVQCTGNEQSLFDCSFTGPWIGLCPHFFDAGVFCYASDNCTNGEVRLLNGNIPNEGRVEVCYNGVWGTIASYQWTDQDAKVVCSQLGHFPYLGLPKRNNFYGSGTINQPIALYYVRCRGNEKTLLDCPFSFPPIYITHSTDAGVHCYTDYDPLLGSGSIPVCSAGTLRLVGGKNDMEGRVEVCLSGAWGTICDDIWNTENANVVCRQLGYTGYGSVALPRSYYGQGNGSIYIDNLRCTGHEDNIWQCSYTGDHNCNHQEDASVRCKPRECTEGAVRLRGGQDELEGRIEVCLNGTWGTICHDYWSGVDSMVVCRQLGYYDKFAFGYNSAFFGTGNGLPILMDNLHCIGNETKLTDCPYETHTADCSHQQDAGVKCFPKDLGSGFGSGAVCTFGDIRLVNGSNAKEGRIEVCINNVWGTVCNDRFHPIDARVACRQLGYSDLGATIVTGVYGGGSGPIFMDNTLCYGEETELLKCLFDSHTADCTHSRDVGVKCYMKGECVDGDIRLANGSRPSEGRVEVCMGGVWGTITGRGWDKQDAIVTCRQLGYSDQYVIAYSNVAFFGEGEGAVHMDYVACTGDELTVLNCTHQKLSPYIINPHALDAGVRCFNLTDAPCTPGDVRLVNGSSQYEGRVETCFDGIWGTVCGSYWIEVDSIVVCRQLGYNDYTALTLSPGYYGLNNASNSSSIPIYFVPICLGTEKTLLDCIHYQVASCTHFHDTAVRCFQTGNCQEGSLRLVGGNTSNEGRVEVCQHGVWGTVCDDLLSQVDARVICRQLGYNDRYVVSFVGGTFGQGTGPIHVDNLDCVGNERRMLDCLYDSHTDDCNHSEDAGVACYNQSQCSHGDIRLVGGNTSYEGRLEFCRSGIWGSVCGLYFDLDDARVICRQLNMNTTYAVPYDAAYYGPGVGEVVIGNLNCNGRESAVRFCQYTSNPSCFHNSDLGVACYPEAQCNETGKIRLVGGKTELEGRVEICLNGVWGTIVHNGWGSNDAAVVCRSLGYLPIGAQPLYFGYFGRGNGRIQMTFVNCNGSEDSLLKCSYSTRISRFDTHWRDAGVRCYPEGECTQGDIRLGDGPTNSEGRVEICVGSTWGTIASFGWSAVDARVVCYQLGFSNEVAFSAWYGAGVGPIYFTGVSCDGDENSIFNCTYSTQTSGISHFFDAGVKCYNKTVPGDCINGDIRLMGGKTNSEGRVELCLEGQWGLVCDTRWSQPDANVVCRQLGFGAYGSTPKYASFFGTGNGKFVVEGISCVGTESELIDCQLDSSPGSLCTSLRTAGVVCLVKNCTEGEIRLRGGTNSQGRVEICKGGVWGTVCDNSWDVSDARVVCRQLGFSGFTAVAVSHAYFGLGNGPIYMNNVYCIGNESSLFNCSFSSQLRSCDHDEDAGVKCFPKTTGGNCSLGDVRLRNGLTENEGRVEVCFNGEWGTVCDKFWDNTDASVVCYQLGYQKVATSFHSGFFPTTKGQIFMDELNCRGDENNLVQCRYDDNIVGCSHDNDAGARCYRSDNCTNGDLQLVNDHIVSSKPTDVISEGRLEICYNSVWSSVSRRFWSQSSTNLACRFLGFNGTFIEPRTVPILNYGIGRGPIISVFCFWSATMFNECFLSSATTRYSHNDDLAILCPLCKDGDLRLSDGPVKNKGRVEICFNNTWGTISDDRWSYFDGKVVCRQLGYSDTILTIRYDAFYNQGTGPIFMTDLICYGSEKRLIDCRHSTDTTDDIHAEDAGIDCYPRGNCTHGELRLANGTMYEGRLEACIDGIWGTVTDDIFSDYEARIACGQMGFSKRFAQHKGNAAYGEGSNLPIVMDNVFCFGQEEFLVNCSYDSVTHFDTHKEDVGIVCHPEQAGNCTLGDIRLVNGTSKYEGLVEICIGGKWGTVCDNSWNQPDALVVCRQLGFSESGVEAVIGSYFGNGTGDIFLANTFCSGNEADLIDCSHSSLTGTCHHGQDAGVICHPGNACTNGDVRLVGGKGDYEGRVEVCSDGVWGTICHDLWDQKDGVVVCRQLNLTYQVVVPFRESYFGPSNHPIVLNRVHCNGDENNLTECDSVKLTGYCSHSDEVGVACLPSMECNHGELRFLNGSNGTQGTIEVCLNGVWGTVCDNYWSTNDAKVACKSLGLLDEYAKPYHSAYFGRGSGPIFLTRLHCQGTENNLTECTHSQDVDCVHAEDAGVQCLAQSECSPNGLIRLVNGSIPSEGRLEVCLNGVWGTVSDDLWDSITAKVICKQLGFDTSALVFFNAYFGQGEGPIHLDNVFCIGYETNILDCSHSKDASEDTHSEDVGIKCLVGGNCTEGEIRLVGGQTEHEGRVEICVKGLWGTVSHSGWEGREAKVVCRQLGYSEEVALAYPYAYFGPGTGPVALTNVICDGTENNLLDCRYISFPDFYNHNNDAGVKCFNQSDNSNCDLGDVRLVDGPQNYSGRVEICFDNQWGTLCGDILFDDIADTVCGQLGFASQGAVAVYSLSAKFGNATGPIWLKEILCFGNEVDILHCLSDPDTQICDHSLDIGVVCAIGECTEGDVRLIDGKYSSEGRVEVCEGRKWGTVCDDGWDYRDALVICKQLGYTGDYALPYHIGYFSGASIPIAIDYMVCTGNETKWTDCSYSTFFTFLCTHDEDAGVKCFNKTISSCTNGEIRLVNGSNIYEGRVEVCLYGNWTTVCSDYWGRTNARVVCRQLGYYNGTALAYKGAYFGQGEGPIYLSTLSCGGSENNLLQCSHTGSTGHCDHSLDAGVRCIPGDECNTTGALRIVNESSPLEGRVEVCIYGVWGTIERTFWETADARLVCRVLGYSPIIADVYNPLPGSGVIHLSYVDCVGNEDSILQCRHSISTTFALHSDDAGVTCSDNISRNCTIGSLQLVNGLSNRQGRVEACLNGKDWSAVSNVNWNNAEVRVICSSLGFAGLGGTSGINTFGYKNESLGLSNVRCAGHETDFFECSFSVSRKMEARGAAATCLPIVDNCTNGDIRLVGGSTQMEGRVEICYGSSWGTISDRFANQFEARVLCRQLGYSSEKSDLSIGYYGIDTSVPIAYTFLLCRGYETHVSQCILSYFPPFNPALSHEDDIGISCQPILISSTLSPSMQLSSLPITPSLMASTIISTMTPSVSASPSSSTMSTSSQTPVLSSSSVLVPLSSSIPVPSSSSRSVLTSSSIPVPLSSSIPVPSSSSRSVSTSSSIPVQLSSSSPVPSSSSSPVSSSSSSSSSSIPTSSSILLPLSSSIPVPSSSSSFVLTSSSSPVPSSSPSPGSSSSSSPVSSSGSSSSSSIPTSSSIPGPLSSSSPVPSSSSSPVSSSRATSLSRSRAPSVVSSTSSIFIQPTIALENALIATINGDFTPNNFPAESFKRSVVSSVNTHCQSNNCRNKKRQTGGLISENDVKIIKVINNNNNGVKVTFYVMQGNNVLAVEILETAVKAGINSGLFQSAGFSDMSVQKTTIVVTSPTNDSSTSGLSTTGTIVLVLVLLIVSIVAASVVIIVIIVWLKHRRNSYSTDKANLVTSTSGTFSTRSSVIEIGERDIEPFPSSEVMTDKELEKYNEAMAPAETSEL